MRCTPPSALAHSSTPHPTLGQLSGSLGETGPPACAYKPQQDPPVPKVVFVRPIVGRLEDLTTVRLTNFHHSADTFALNNEDGFLHAALQVDPSPALLAIEYLPGSQEGVHPYGFGLGNLRHTFRE